MTEVTREPVFDAHTVSEPREGQEAHQTTPDVPAARLPEVQRRVAVQLVAVRRPLALRALSAVVVSRLRGVGGRGAAGLRAGLRLSALSQPDDLRLSKVPELPSAHSRDLATSCELTQPLVADLQFVGCHCERNQAILLHGRDSNDYANSLPRGPLLFAKISGKLLGKSQRMEAPSDPSVRRAAWA